MSEPIVPIHVDNPGFAKKSAMKKTKADKHNVCRDPLRNETAISKHVHFAVQCGRHKVHIAQQHVKRSHHTAHDGQKSDSNLTQRIHGAPLLDQAVLSSYSCQTLNFSTARYHFRPQTRKATLPSPMTPAVADAASLMQRSRSRSRARLEQDCHRPVHMRSLLKVSLLRSLQRCTRGPSWT